MTSINTNIYAMQALFGLDRANQQLGVAQKRVNTGYRVNDANDDGATFAIAQSVRGNINAYDAVIERLQLNKGLIGETRIRLEGLSDLINQLNPIMLKLADPSVTGQTRSQYHNDAINIAGQISNLASANSSRPMVFGGTVTNNLLSVGFGGTTSIISSISGSALSFMPTAPGNASIVSQTSFLSSVVSAATTANVALTAIPQISGVTRAVLTTMNNYAVFERRIDNAIQQNQTLRDAAEIGLGAMVDADMARESAKLQSAQIKQQMAIQSLGIANNSNRNILGLFR